MTKKHTNPELYKSSLFSDGGYLQIVQARFVETTVNTFEELLRDFSSMRVLTYSNSVSIIAKSAELVNDLEIIFGREDIVGEMTKYMHFQELLLEGIKAEIKGKEAIQQRIEAGTIRLRVVKEIISHEKMFLLQKDGATRVITGSANFSERAFSGSQNESFIVFDNDPAAWEYFSAKYEAIRIKSTVEVAERALLADDFDPEHLPVLNLDPAFGDKSSGSILVIHDGPPAPTIIHKLVTTKTPKHYDGLSQVITSDKGVFHITRQIKAQVIQYIKSNSRTSDRTLNK